MTAAATEIIKFIASCNQSTRSKGVRLLLKHLPQQPEHLISDSDLLKICKGLFYCTWHADKPPFQLDLINKLSSLLETCPFDLSIRFFQSFIITIRRAWCGIDLLRLDKFYLLIRRFLSKEFTVLKKNGWDIELVNGFVNVLDKKLFFVAAEEDKYAGNGVGYHVCEVFLDEIVMVDKEIFELLLSVFVRILERSCDRVLVGKVRGNVFERIWENGVKYLHGETGEDVEKLGKHASVLGFSDKFFKAASSEETVQGNRKVLFGLHEKFLKLEKDFEKREVKVKVPIDGSGNGNEVEMEVGSGDGGSDVRPLKKRKKEKKSADSKETSSKKKKMVGNEVDGKEAKIKSGKKKNKKKKDSLESSIESNSDVNVMLENDEKASFDEMRNDDLVDFNESLISNLQKQFEKIAAEEGMRTLPKINKKRKRVKSVSKKATTSTNDEQIEVKRGENSGEKSGMKSGVKRGENSGEKSGVKSGVKSGEKRGEKSGEKSGKRVRFSMNNNLVWKPQTPMPPQSLRLPPSATPRGSALKKGVLPGPVKGSPATVKKINARGSSVKKARKSTLKTVSPALKRLRKLQILSP